MLDLHGTKCSLTACRVLPLAEGRKCMFWQAPGFKAWVIELKRGGRMPSCQTAYMVLFAVLRGRVTVRWTPTPSVLTEG